ncbi:MAG: hypothetical protein KDB61_16035 [Planctomycetes bacterium]|nr:hypothetical protein [Planctomycetota bacterium]
MKQAIVWGGATLLLLGLARVVSAQEGETGKADPARVQATAPTDGELRKAWKALKPEDQRRAAEWFSQEARHLPCFQNTLIAYMLGSLEKDRYDWPEPGPQETFDPALHCPAQPIPRVPQAIYSAEYQSTWKQLLG